MLKKRVQAISSFAVIDTIRSLASINKVVIVACLEAFQSIELLNSEKIKLYNDFLVSSSLAKAKLEAQENGYSALFGK